MSRTWLPALEGHSPLWHLAGIALSVAVLAVFSPCLAQDWQISYVDGPRWFDEMGERSLRLDHDGVPHVAYWNSPEAWAEGAFQLWYATMEGTHWRTELVYHASGPPTGASLAVDALSMPHIAWIMACDSTLGRWELRYARKVAACWEISTVDTGTKGGLSGLAVDGQDRVHVCYESLADSGGLLYGFMNTTGGWEIDQVDGTIHSLSTPPSMAVDCHGRPHIAYDGNTYAIREQSGWVIDHYWDGATHASLALDSLGVPHIMGATSNQGYSLRHAWIAGLEWQIETAATGSRAIQAVSGAMDRNGCLHVGYLSGEEVRYAWRDSVGWRNESTMASARPGCVSLDVEASGMPWITVIRRVSSLHEARITHRQGGGWASSKALDWEAASGTWSSIDFLPDGSPAISYRESFHRDLRLACLGGIAWRVEIVDEAGDAGIGSALAIDGMGQPHIVYYAGTAAKYAHHDGLHWSVETIEPAANPGFYPSRTGITIDGGLRTHVVYQRRDTEIPRVIYAVRQGCAWEISMIAEGQRPSLVLDLSQKPHILFRSAAWPYYLSYAQWSDCAWHVDRPDSAVWGESSLIVDSAGHPHISYQRYPGQSRPPGLWYACHDGSEWHTEPVDPWTYVGWFSSIAIDHGGRPLICYTKEGNVKDLRFAWKDCGTWHIRVIDDSHGAGEYCSLALDNEGHRHVSYCDPRTRSLKYAFSTGEGLWVHGVPPNVSDLTLCIEGPCPSTGMTPFGLFLAEPSPVNVSVFDLGGRRIRIVAASPLPEGTHRLIWDGLDDRGLRVPSWTYICSAEAAGVRASTRVVVIR